MISAFNFGDGSSAHGRIGSPLAFKAGESFGKFAHGGRKSLHLLSQPGDLVTILRSGFAGILFPNERASPRS